MTRRSRCRATLLAAAAFALLPQTGWAKGCKGGVAGHISIHFSESSPLIWVGHPFSVSATLCKDGSAVGGGIANFILAAPYTFADPVFELAQGTEMTFEYRPYAWQISTGPHPKVDADLMPIGSFRQLLLDKLDGDAAALEGWETFISAPFPEGGYALNGDGKVDLRITSVYR